jgi:hypothetical protein
MMIDEPNARSWAAGLGCTIGGTCGSLFIAALVFPVLLKEDLNDCGGLRGRRWSAMPRITT